MDTQKLVVLCTCPDTGTARRIAGELVEAKLAACANIMPQLTSVFWWEGEVQTEPEALLVIKTHDAAYPRLEEAIRRSHPYELPEVIAVPINSGLQGYLDWIDESVRAS